MADLPRIPVPWAQRWRMIRFRILPLGCFLACVVVTGWLWSRHYGGANAVGMVFAERVDVTSSIAGRLGSVDRDIQLFDRVQQGKLVARLDSSDLVSQLKVHQAEVDHLTASLAEIKDTVDMENQDRLSRAKLSEESDRIRLEVELSNNSIKEMDTQVRLFGGKAQLVVLNEMLRIKLLADNAKVISKLDIATTKAERDKVQAEVKSNEKLLTQIQTEMTKISELLKNSATKVPLDRPDARLATVHAEIQTHMAMIDQVTAQIETLDIHAPIDGIVTAILARPGQAVTAGQPIMTIAAEHSQYVVSYLRQGRAVEAKPGMLVDIHPRTIPVRPAPAVIDQVSRQIEMAPQPTWRDSRIPEWGQLVRIPLPPTLLHLRPGELVDIRIRDTDTGGDKAPPALPKGTQAKAPGPPET